MLTWPTTNIVLCIQLLFYWIVPLLSLVHECPVSTHYPFACSACLSFSEHNATRSAAEQHCQEQGGRLVTVHEQLEWEILQLYLESLDLSTTGVWVGYRLGEGGELSGEEWSSAPRAVVESLQRSLRSGGGECVMVRGGEMVNTRCSEELRYVCVFSYPAPSLAVSHPPPGLVYHSPSLTLSFVASISGSGITDLEWRRDNVPLAPSLTVEMRMSHDNTWAMLNVSSESSDGYKGFYELLVTNPAGRTVVATWTVQPASLGSFTRSPQDLTIPQGSIAFFECSADNAVPAPIYTWLKGGDPVVPDKTRVYVSNVTHTLLVRDVGPGDAGNYSCHVENSAGTMTSSPAALTVRSQAEFEDSAPRFLLHPRNLTLLEGSFYSMDCVALHTSPTYFYIMILLTVTDNFRYPSYEGTPALTMGSVSLDHSGGRMVCFANKALDVALIPSQPGYLTIHSCPHIKPLVTNIGNGTGPHSIPDTTKLAVSCLFGGVPVPSQRWYRNGTLIPSEEVGAVVSSGREEARGTLELEQPQSGVYQCLISSQYGTAISTTSVCVQTVPGPTPFSVVADSTTSLYVIWSPPQPPSLHPLLLRYEILTTHILTGTTFSSGTLLPSSPWVVEGLNASSEYLVRVKSWSPLGKGADGQELTVFTFGPAPQRSPLDFLNVTVSRTHQNRGLVIQWHPTPLPPPPGTVFAYYQVQYRRVGEEGDGLASMAGAEKSWIYIDMLENAHNFEIRLRVGVQVRRSPAEYDYTPWSGWMGVEGVTTPPTTPTVPTTTPKVGPSESVEEDNREEVLLVAVLVPVLSVVVLVALLVPVTVGGWRFWAKRRAASYTPSRLERQRIKGTQVPMGKEVFDLEPGLAAATMVEEEEAAYCTMSTLRTTISTSRPSSRSEELTVDSPVMQSSNVE